MLTINLCGISKKCVSACRISTNKKPVSQRNHLGMETNPANCWVHCRSLPFLAIPRHSIRKLVILSITRRLSPFHSIKKPQPLRHTFYTSAKWQPTHRRPVETFTLTTSFYEPSGPATINKLQISSIQEHIY